MRVFGSGLNLVRGRAIGAQWCTCCGSPPAYLPSGENSRKAPISPSADQIAAARGEVDARAPCRPPRDPHFGPAFRGFCLAHRSRKRSCAGWGLRHKSSLSQVAFILSTLPALASRGAPSERLYLSTGSPTALAGTGARLYRPDRVWWRSDLIEKPDGTLLRLTHTGLPNAEQCAGHAEGWEHYIARLAEYAAGRDPGPDPWSGRV